MISCTNIKQIDLGQLAFHLLDLVRNALPVFPTNPSTEYPTCSIFSLHYTAYSSYPTPKIVPHHQLFSAMTFTKSPTVVHGGCNCRAIRYKVDVPAFSERPQNPYRTPGADVGDLRIPMAAICHCNDCRRATANILPMVLVTLLSTVSVQCEPRSSSSSGLKAAAELKWVPAAEVFDHTNLALEELFLAHYESSEGRSRWFCRRCGTNLAYTIHPGVVPEEWGWPRMLDIWLGTVDRDDLDKEWMVPERMLWCDFGVDWVRKWSIRGGGGIPEHPTTKIDQLVGEEVMARKADDKYQQFS